MSTADVALSGTVLPAVPGAVGDDLTDLTAGWLRGFDSIHTRVAYRRDLTGFGANLEPVAMKTPAWLPWCVANGIDPLSARRGGVAAYARQIEADGHSPATRARKLSAVSSWYDYLIAEELIDRNPAKTTGRPNIDRDVSPAVGLSEEEVDALLDQAAADGTRSDALISLLYFGAFRVGSVLGADIGDLGWKQNSRTLKMKVKGGDIKRVTIERAAELPLTRYLDSRGELARTSPLFATSAGARMSELQAWRLVRRLAREAGVKAWAELNPHTLRHAHATLARDAGVGIDIVQDTLGHKDTRTTLRYDRARGNRGRSGTVLSERRLERLGR